LSAKDEKADSEPKIQIETTQAALGHECLSEQTASDLHLPPGPARPVRKVSVFDAKRQHADKHTYQIFDEDSKHEATN
jgi:hypothetical protein